VFGPFERLAAIVRKETRELLRDPVFLGLGFFVPMMLMLMFGYGLNTDVKNLPVLFIDHDRTPVSRDYIDSFVHSEYFRLVGVTSDAHEAESMLRTGRARVVIDIPPDFARRLAGLETATVGVTVDGSFPARGEVIKGYVTAINALYDERLLGVVRAREGLASAPPVRLDLSVWYNPSLESLNVIVPGMMALILMLFPALLGALLIVRERESGTIFNFFASPVRRVEILFGKAIPYVAFSFLDYLALFAMGEFLFHVPFTGSFFVLTASALLYSFCTIGIGLLISALTRTQLAAMLITFIVTLTPAFNYSGFLAPVAAQDAVGQFIARLIPATYFMEVVRGSYLKGLGFEAYRNDLAALLLYTFLLYAAAWAALRKRIG